MNGEQSFCERACSRQDWDPTRECAAMPDRDRGWHGDALCCSRAGARPRTIKHAVLVFAPRRLAIYAAGNASRHLDATCTRRARYNPCTVTSPIVRRQGRRTVRITIVFGQPPVRPIAITAAFLGVTPHLPTIVIEQSNCPAERTRATPSRRGVSREGVTLPWRVQSHAMACWGQRR
jgi:hypothetical protein